jgi:phage protein D
VKRTTNTFYDRHTTSRWTELYKGTISREHTPPHTHRVKKRKTPESTKATEKDQEREQRYRETETTVEQNKKDKEPRSRDANEQGAQHEEDKES